MTQPDFVPTTISVAKFYREETLVREIKRPAELKGRRRSSGRLFGSPGPDQGYVLHLVDGYKEKLVLRNGEAMADVVTALVVVALKRASVFGRAPMKSDIDFAIALLRFSQGIDDNFAEVRKRLITGVTHDYVAQRELADLFSEDLLKLTPQGIEDHNEIWEEWLEKPSTLSA